MGYSLIIKILLFVCVLILLKILVYGVTPFVYQYFLLRGKDLSERYGNGTWGLVTGASSGIGKHSAFQLASRGFNVLLVGSSRCKKIKHLIEQNYPVSVLHIEKDFSKSFEPNFFAEIEEWAKTIDTRWSILINNVGKRVGNIRYEDLPLNDIKATVSVGTIPQSRLTQIALKCFIKRHYQGMHSSIVNVTALCTRNTDLFAYSPTISLPYLSAYEATNAFGFYHSESVRKELDFRGLTKSIDFLTITPGSVITENTKDILEAPLKVNADVFAKNMFNIMGTLHGPQCAYWGHSMSGAVFNIAPLIGENVIQKVSYNLAANLTI